LRSLKSTTCPASRVSTAGGWDRPHLRCKV
jgi:hypothetical protein